MPPYLPALALLVCAGVAVSGVRLLRAPGVGIRFGEPSSFERVTGERASLITKFYDLLGRRLGPPALDLLGPERTAAIQHRIDAAGRPGGLDLQHYAGRKATFTLLMGAVGSLFLVQGNVVMFVLSLVAGFIWIDIWLAGLLRRRQAAIERSLPDFLDVLAVTVGAGTAFRPALRRVAESFEGPLSDEVATALRQMQFGLHQREAFQRLRDRNDSANLDEFVGALLQAEELGAPLTQALGELADSIRRSWGQEARRLAQRASPRISLIVALTVLPAAVILIVVGVFVSSGIDLGTFSGGT